MFPLKFRHNSGSKLAKLPLAQNSQAKFPAGFQPSGHSPSMAGSLLGSFTGSAPGSSRLNIGQWKAPTAQSNKGLLPGASANSAPTQPHAQVLSRQQGGPVLVPDPRRVIVGHIIRDCYSKLVTFEGKKVPEVKYNTHLLIREYALYPQSAPPTDLSPAQIGLVKSRILVVCTKHTGRVLLQKGKYNDQKKIYQIGRTWDLDELVCISRVADDAVILQLNKNYYWKSGDAAGRLQKFIHHLVIIYQRFIGQYPEMQGFTLDSLGLAAPHVLATASSSTISSHASYKSGSPGTSGGSLNHYKDLDFTVNGKLPMKPMQVMDVDRPSPSSTSTPVSENSTQGTSTRQSAESFNFKNAYDSSGVSKGSPVRHLREPSKRNTDHSSYAQSLETKSSNESQSLVFAGDDAVDESKAAMPTILEYARKNGLLLPLKNFKPDREKPRPRDVSDNLDTAASYGAQLANQLGLRLDISEDVNVFNSKAKDNDSIEEASVLSDSIETPVYVSSKKSLPAKQLGGRELSKKDSVIDDSIREIEDFMADQLCKETSRGDSRSPATGPSRDVPELAHPRENASSEAVSDLALVSKKSQVPENAIKAEGEIKFEKDPEIEELLDEIEWNPTDGSDQCVKMLRKELTSIKHKNVLELTMLDFGKDTLANEVKISIEEVDNLVEVFKQMEVTFKMIAPQISGIESNSKGLQVEAVNKKILYNELTEIMHKVRLSDRDLQAVANYNEFEDTSMVPILEGKLLTLYDALGVIGNKTPNDDLSQMRALKQFNETYEKVGLLFVHRYLDFITAEFKLCIERLSKDVSNLSPESMLPSFCTPFAFSGVNIFVKGVSERDFIAISDKFNAYVANLLDNVLSSKIRALYSVNNSARNSRLTFNSEPISGLKKSRSSRFGSTRLLGRLTGGNGEQDPKAKPLEQVPRGAEEVSDALAIVRLVKESTDFMLVVQFLLGTIFHLTSEDDFSTFLTAHSFEERLKWYDKGDVDAIHYKTNSNEILRNMSIIFGNFINKFTREVMPADLIIVQVLARLLEMLADAESKSQDFVAYSFLLKLAERYRANWDRFIAHQVDLFQKSDVRAKGGVLAAVRNLNQIITLVETSRQDSQDANLDSSEINLLILHTYERLTKAAADLFHREDPLLKSNSHDEKERAHRNVAILQNLYYILQPLGEHDSSASANMKKELDEVFTEVEKEYFDYIVRMHLGRISEYVHGHSSGEHNSKNKNKEDKILVRGISASFTAKEIAAKTSEMFKNMQKHVISSDMVFEHDLLDLLWKHLEGVVEGVFRQFQNIARTYDRDIDESISVGEIRRHFNAQHKIKW